MFRWLLKPKFYSKCISHVKVIKTRLEIAQKKKSAAVKFTKGDIAELLRRGFDYEAYKRVEELVLDQNRLFCYELIAKFTECISDHVEDLTKQRICPDECKEAVPSLMYAAARFADLPELRDLRTLFAEKFENFLEPFISKELVEKLRRDPPARETKIRVLHDIAQEFSVEWNDKALKKILHNPQPSSHGERPKQSPRRKDLSDESVRYRSSSDDDTSTDASSRDGKKASSSSFGSTSEDEVLEIKRPISSWLFPPPYLKPRTNQGEQSTKKATDSEAQPRKEPSKYLHEPVVKEKKTARSTRRRSHEPLPDPKTDNAATLADSGGTTRTSHVRGKSVPTDPTNAAEEKSKDYTRAFSFDTGTSQGSARHVHPNLPDYDDLVARLASLTGRS